MLARAGRASSNFCRATGHGPDKADLPERRQRRHGRFCQHGVVGAHELAQEARVAQTESFEVGRFARIAAAVEFNLTSVRGALAELRDAGVVSTDDPFWFRVPNEGARPAQRALRRERARSKLAPTTAARPANDQGTVVDPRGA